VDGDAGSLIACRITVRPDLGSVRRQHAATPPPSFTGSNSPSVARGWPDAHFFCRMKGWPHLASPWLHAYIAMGRCECVGGESATSRHRASLDGVFFLRSKRRPSSSRMRSMNHRHRHHRRPVPAGPKNCPPPPPGGAVENGFLLCARTSRISRVLAGHVEAADATSGVCALPWGGYVPNLGVEEFMSALNLYVQYVLQPSEKQTNRTITHAW